MFVCFYPINVKTAELIGAKFCVGPHREGLWMIKISKFAYIKIRLNLNTNSAWLRGSQWFFQNFFNLWKFSETLLHQG